ncbi:MAG TPA: hypothetical protein VK211_29265 [Kamptonema sp.]|nr:hypothetical protein [Kamptonema sp.]
MTGSWENDRRSLRRPSPPKGATRLKPKRKTPTMRPHEKPPEIIWGFDLFVLFTLAFEPLVKVPSRR